MAEFKYGWDDETSNPDPLTQDPNNPLGAGGATGSYVGSQTGGQGAGITPNTMTTGLYNPQPSQYATRDEMNAATGAGAGGDISAKYGNVDLSAAGAGGDLSSAQVDQNIQNTFANYTPNKTDTQAQDAANLQPQYESQVAAIQNATDPQQAALAKDQLSRQLYSSLSEQGHDVKWDGDNLIVDGRPYIVGGPVAKTGGTTAPTATAPQAGQWAPNNQGFLDWATQTYGADPTRGGGFVAMPQGQSFQDVLARYSQETGNVANYLGGPSGDRVDFGQGIQDALTSGGQIWNAAGGGGGGTAPAMGGDRQWIFDNGPTGMPQAPGTTTQWDAGLQAALNRQGDFSVPQVGQPTLPSDLAGWRPSGSSYTPGEIGFGDIPGFDYTSLMGDMNKGNENYDALMQQLMLHPESLDQQTVDTMKAQMKNTVAEQQQQEEEDLKGFGAASGIGDSGWLASQRAASRRGRDMGVAAGAQNIDIEAAKTRMGDRRAAAELGTKYASQKSQNVQMAADASLKRSAVLGDRMKLREDVKAQAAKLGIEADQVMSGFIANQQDNLMKKYGIDMGAAVDMKKLGEQSQEWKEGLMQKMAELERSLSMQKYGIDTSAATSKYATDVGAGTSRYGVDVSADTAAQARRQQDEQFAADLGLRYEDFNRMRQNDDWKRLTDLYGTAK